MDKSDLDLFLEELEKVDPEITKEELNVVPVTRVERPEEVTPVYPSPEIKTRIYTDYRFIRELKERDFNLKLDTLIDLSRETEELKINDGYYFILFMNESDDGREYLQRWIELAQIAKNDYCKLAFVNLTFETKILENFKKLARIENINHPFYWARFTEFPFMMVYRNYWPVGFYNGPKLQPNFLDFIIKDIYQGTMIISKEHTLRSTLNSSLENELVESEKKIEVRTLKERAVEEDKKRKEKLKELDPKNQEILENINLNF